MIQDILPRYQEVADGSKTAFTFPFDTLKDDFIEVYLDTVKVTTGWSLSGKTITFTTAPEDGVVVTIYRNIPIKWVEDNLGGVNPEAVENICTYLVAQIQTIKEGLRRAIQTRITDTDKGEDVSDDYIDSLGQATSLYNQCTSLLTQIETTGEYDLEQMASILRQVEDYWDNITNLISTDTSLGNSDSLVPSQKAVKTYVDNKDDGAVHLVGDETITGAKTIKDDGFGGSCFSFKSTTMDLNDNTKDAVYVISLMDSHSRTIGNIQARQSSDGTFGLGFSYPGYWWGFKKDPTNNTVKFILTTPTEDTTSSLEADTVGARNTKLQSYVSLAGAETISGEKTYSTMPVLSFPNEARGTAPSSAVYGGIAFLDGDGERMAILEKDHLPDGSISLNLRVSNPTTTGTGNQATLGVTYPMSGNPYATAPTPATSSNTTNIATTAYVNNKLVKVSALPASPDSNVYYFIPE